MFTRTDLDRIEIQMSTINEESPQKISLYEKKNIERSALTIEYEILNDSHEIKVSFFHVRSESIIPLIIKYSFNPRSGYSPIQLRSSINDLYP